MKNDFDELSRLDTSEERIFELEGKEADTSKIKKEQYAKRKNSVKKTNIKNSQELIVGELQKVSHRCNGNRVGKERERGIEAIFEAILTEKFPKLITDPGSSENIK